MRILIRHPSIEMPRELRGAIHERIRLALERYSSHVTSASAYFTDVNGPKGGVDLRCRLVAKLGRMGNVIIEGHGDNLQRLIEETSERLESTVGRRIERYRYGDERVPFGGNPGS